MENMEEQTRRGKIGMIPVILAAGGLGLVWNSCFPQPGQAGTKIDHPQ